MHCQRLCVNLTKKHYRIGLGLFALAILTASSIPGKSLPSLIVLSPDKLLHVDEYSILGYLAYKSFESVSLILFIGAFIFAGFDEFWQSFIPGRSPSIYDVIADIIGFILVAGTLYYRSRKFND